MSSPIPIWDTVFEYMDTTMLQLVNDIVLKYNTNVDIVAVTKTHPYGAITEAYSKGYRHMGENRVEEAINKISLAHQNNLNDIVWHMIGHVQSRKVRDVIAHFDRVDSVDSIELLKKLDIEAEIQNKVLHVLLEVNISGEERKYGFRTLNASMLQRVRVPHIVIDGLMTMPPYVINPEDNRVHFRALKDLSVSLRSQFPLIGSVLSMGTSCDYQVAIEEGATEVRLGEALFGKRE